MQTQDVKYITMKKTIEANKIRRMQSELHMIDEANNVKNTHTFFTDDGEVDTNVDLAKRLDTHPALLHRRTNRPRLKDLSKLSLLGADIEVCLLIQIHNNFQSIHYQSFQLFCFPFFSYLVTVDGTKIV